MKLHVPDKTKRFDMPHLRKKMAEVDKKRLMRIKEARDSKEIKKLAALWADEKLKPKILTPAQRAAINLLADFTKNYSNAYVIARLNVTASEFYKWRNDPLFIKELDKEITNRLTFIRIHAFRNVHRAVMRGSMKDTWMYLKMTGDLTEKHELVDKTEAIEMSDDELNEEILHLQEQLNKAHTPSGN